jgi:drug/metabolite transporter (DMT)-like permease
MWFLFAMGSALFFAAQSTAAKRVSDELHPDVTTWGAFVFAVPIYLVALALDGIPEVRPAFWWFTGMSVGVNLVALPLFFRSLARTDLSLALPLASLSPLFALGTEYALLGEVPSPLVIPGVTAIVVGAWVLQVDKARGGLLAPLVALGQDQGARGMLIVAALWSVAAVADRGAVLASSPAFYNTVFDLSFLAAFMPFVLWRGRPLAAGLRRYPVLLVMVGVLGAAMALFQMAAIEIAPAANVIAIKRLAALIGVLVGWLVFHERGIGGRLGGASLMVGGAIHLGMVA